MMIMSLFSTLSSVGMAVGPPLVYLDQYRSIQKNKTSLGFSHGTCLVLLVANITRMFYWLGERFDTALLIQSILMVITQLALLRLCLRYSAPNLDQRRDSISSTSFIDGHSRQSSLVLDDPSTRSLALPITPIQSNQSIPVNSQDPQISNPPPNSSLDPSSRFFSYLDRLAILIAAEAVLLLVFQRYDWFVQTIGFLALGLESTLPIPQLIANHKRKSLAGFSTLVLFGWLFGDAFKSVYLIIITPAQNPIQFKICALFQLSIDCLIFFQSLLYRHKTKLDTIDLLESPSSASNSILQNP